LRGSIKLFSIFGIPVDINATWLIAVALITWSLATTAYPSFFGHWSGMQYWLAGITTTLLLFLSVLLHELGHSITALSQGLKVSGITLLLFGGVSKIQGKASRPRNEFLIAFAGPAVSLIIGVALTLWWFTSHPVYESQITPIQGIIFFTGWMNIIVAAFNLLPGYPMDGGRVLRSAVWAITGDTKLASRVAYHVGRVVFYLLIGWGAWQILNGDMMGGIWIVFIGWFLMSSAKGEMKGEMAADDRAAQPPVMGTEGLGHLSFEVGQATRPMPPMFESSWSVEQVTYKGLPEHPLTSIPVARRGELMGFIIKQDLDNISLERRGDVTIGELMSPDSLRVISRHDSVGDALREMDRHRLNQLVVMDDDFVIGIVTRQDIVEVLLRLKMMHETSTSTDDERSL
jgi:Zn-dependent protease